MLTPARQRRRAIPLGCAALMRRLVVMCVALLALPAVAIGAPALRKAIVQLAVTRGAIVQLPARDGCAVGEGRFANGCAIGRGTRGVYMVALSPDGRSAYAPAQDSEGISVYRRRRASGALAARGCLAQSDPACRPGNGMHGAFWAQVAPDGAHVYLTASDDSSIVTLRRDPATGALTELACQINASGAQKPSIGCAPVRAFNTPREFALTRDGRFLYAATFTSNGVAAFARDPATGALAQLPANAGCVKEGGGSGCAPAHGLAGPTGVAISPDARSVYVTSFQGDGVVTLARDPQTGALAQTGCLNAAGSDGCAPAAGLRGAYGVAVSPDGCSVYVAARKSRAVAIFVRDPATGALSQRPGTDACVSDAGGGCAGGRGLYGARGVDVSPDGHNVYVGAYSADAVSVFARDPASGVLAQLPGRTGCVSNATGRRGPPTTRGCARARGLNGAWGVTVSPDGHNLYAGAQISNGFAVFARNR